MIGERVRLARQARRLTQMQLADAARIPQERISDIERGFITDPPLEWIQKISRATLYPVSFFYLGPLPDLPEGNYRKLKRGSAKITDQVRAEVRQVLEVVQKAEGMLRLPPVNLEPVRSVPADLQEIEAIATSTRQALGVGRRDPIPNLMRAIERAGVVVIELPSEMEDHDGFSAWPDYGLDGRPIIAVSKGGPGDRTRATVAHELGHILFHTLRPSTPPNIAEKEAWRFAGALMLPAETARMLLRPPITLSVLRSAKAVTGMSIGMNAQRALDLQLLSSDQYVSLRKQLSVRGWNRNEPVQVEVERPLLIKKIVAKLAGEGTVAQRAERLGLPPFALNSLIN